jgi:hypothetical protein
VSIVMTNPDTAQLSLDLTEEEQNELETCERIIERNLKAFMETGGALMTISDKRLYRATHSTFDSYCREKWNISRQYAYELMSAADIAEQVSGIPDIPTPANPAQALALKSVAEPDRAEVWQEAVETAPEGRMTAAHVQSVVEKRTEPDKPAHISAQENQVERPDTSNLLKKVSDVEPTTAPAPAKPAQNIPENIPAPAKAPEKPAESAPAQSGMMTVLIPADEDDWLWEQGLTGATAITKLREVMDQLDLATAALQRPQLTPVAENALNELLSFRNARSDEPTTAPLFLEAILVARLAKEKGGLG